MYFRANISNESPVMTTTCKQPCTSIFFFLPFFFSFLVLLILVVCYFANTPTKPQLAQDRQQRQMSDEDKFNLFPNSHPQQWASGAVGVEEAAFAADPFIAVDQQFRLMQNRFQKHPSKFTIICCKHVRVEKRKIFFLITMVLVLYTLLCF